MNAAALKATPACADLALRRVFAGRRRILAAIMLSVPVLIALGTALIRRLVLDEQFQNEWFFHGLMDRYVFYLMMTMMGLIFGLSLSSGDIEDGTAGYLFLTVLPRWWIALVNVLVTALALATLIFLCVLASRTAWRMGAVEPFSSGDLTVSFRYGVVGLFGITTYLALFSFIGYAFRRPVAVSIGAAIGWEFIVTHLPFKIGSFTVTNNLRGVILYAILGGNPGRIYRHVQVPDYTQAAWTLTCFIGISLALMMIAVMNRDLAGREAG